MIHTAKRWQRLAILLCLLPAFALEAQTIDTTHDHFPRFAASPSIVSVKDGSWSDAATWSPSRVPQSTDIVRITHAVTYNVTTGDAAVIGIENGGAMRFATNVATRLRVGTLQLVSNGVLEVGTAAAPVDASVTAEIIIKDRPIDSGIDPQQYGTGILTIDSRVTMHGATKNPTFVRTASEPRAGQTVIQVESPVTGWRVGDKVFVPDTRQLANDDRFNHNLALQVETLTITAISGDGKSITVSPGLLYNHAGARDADGTPTVLSNGIKLLPHVGNISRNVIVRSENPSGTRGHALFTNRADVELFYVQFEDLGRTRAAPLNASTNHIARYPVHMHHLIGPVNPSNTGYQFELVGNSVIDGLKWPITVHASHFGLIKDNVVLGGTELTGAGIATEHGSETGNLFENNFVANIKGTINPRESYPDSADGTTPGSAGECIWAAGFNNRYVDNVASTCHNGFREIVNGPGFKFIVKAAAETITNPRFRGADMSNTAQTISVQAQRQPIVEFRGNEVYGIAADGFTAWQLGTDGYEIPTGISTSVVKDFRVWHTAEGAIYNYPANKMTFENLVFRMDGNSAAVDYPAAFRCSDYRNVDINMRGGSIHAGNIFSGDCTDPLGTYRFQDIEAVTKSYAFNFKSPATPGTLANRPSLGLTVLLHNNDISPWPGQPLRTVRMDYNTSQGNSQTDDKFEVFVTNYQGQIGNNFRVYFTAQGTQNTLGAMAPCQDTTSHPEISGITCATTGTPPAPLGPSPGAPSNLSVQ